MIGSVNTDVTAESAGHSINASLASKFQNDTSVFFCS